MLQKVTKKPGDSNALRESTLALALVIPDYRPDMHILMQAQDQFMEAKGGVCTNGFFHGLNQQEYMSNGLAKKITLN